MAEKFDPARETSHIKRKGFGTVSPGCHVVQRSLQVSVRTQITFAVLALSLTEHDALLAKDLEEEEMQSRGRSGEKSFHCAFKPSPFERLNQFTFKFNPDEDCQKKKQGENHLGAGLGLKKTFFVLLLSVANRLDRMEPFPLTDC